MSERDGPSVHVNLLWVEFELAHAVHAHGSECFIDLRPLSHMSDTFFFIHTSNRSTSFTERPTFSNTFGMAIVGPTPMIRGAKPEHMRSVDSTSDQHRLTCDSCVGIFSKDSKPQLVCFSSRHQQHGGSTVRYLTRVPS